MFLTNPKTQHTYDVVVVGSGVTGVEFVHMFRSFGCGVTLIVSRQQVLPGKDPEVAAALEDTFIDRGVKLFKGARAESIEAVADEVAELVSAGLPPMIAINAATSTAAMCLELGASTGAVRPGLEADLVVIERDPLLDIDALHDVALVVNDGIVVLDRLAQ